MKIYSLNPVPPTIPKGSDSNVFYEVGGGTCTLYVPEGSYSAYWIAPSWGSFSNIVESASLAYSKISADSYSVESINGGLSIKGKTQEISVEIYTMNGVLVYIGNENIIALTPGIYFLKINNMVTKAIVY